ncbi:hypothetical protein H310_00647 [Aphanomyces invadans]|uniref:glucan endo-1,3-beta-D-glucosidase n=1 Tax=Aphanomyces invadans TaxID=157072 RepID=A0A024UWJ0_9STRA|nr:hypothetical protein H310_00647 [Aphanomyces invadans]ETW10307.1 hypothetical protein H310_00647 [Aphanomyces invadans]|eukprot:XP_008861718.1 hypothetical protein H310_00647 [Aphanomyces invadans]
MNSGRSHAALTFDTTAARFHAPPESVDGLADRPLSVSYDSHEAWVPGKVESHFKRIKERFAGVRTFQTAGVENHIDVAAMVGLKVYAGVWIQGASTSVEADMQAAVDGARRHSSNVAAIFVGNEDLMDGRVTEQFVVARVRQMKGLLASAGLKIPVGSVQTDGDWLDAPTLAAECDVVGVNIHPFFSGAADSGTEPVLDLGRRWTAMTRRYPTTTLVLTETGWPTSGRPFTHHVPSLALAEKYANEVDWWVRQGNGGHLPAYFMFHDNLGKSDDFERSFGLAWASGEWKFGGGEANPAAVPVSSPRLHPSPPLANTTSGVFITTIQVPHTMVAVVLAVVHSTYDPHEHRQRPIEYDPIASTRRQLDSYARWTCRGSLVVASTSDEVELCLDAYEPWSGGNVHAYPCDAQNVNQLWAYDTTTRQLSHQRHRGYCLGIVNNAPRLALCTEGATFEFATNFLFMHGTTSTTDLKQSRTQWPQTDRRGLCVSATQGGVRNSSASSEAFPRVPRTRPWMSASLQPHVPLGGMTSRV